MSRQYRDFRNTATISKWNKTDINIAELAADFVSSIEEYLADYEAEALPAEKPKVLSVT